MSEQVPKPIPETAIQDPALAEHMAYGEKTARGLGKTAIQVNRAGVEAGKKYLDELHGQVEVGADKPNTPSAEALRAGYTLGPEELVGLDVTRNPEHIGSPVKLGKEGQITASDAVHVATVRFGGQNPGNYAKAYVYDVAGGFTFEGKPIEGWDDRATAIQIIDSNGHRTNTMSTSMSTGMLEIGRNNPGQEGLGPMISGDQAALGFSADRQLLVENHNPSNLTEVQRMV